MNNTAKLIISLAIPLALGAIAGYFTATSVDGWFTTLQKPSFNPPNSIFAPVWTSLYILMGIGLYLVWKQPIGTPYKSTAMAIFAIQMALNFLWSFLFFKMEQPLYALADIIVLWLFVLLMIIYFIKVKPIAGYLQIPYILWVGFATVLNLSIWMLNR